MTPSAASEIPGLSPVDLRGIVERSLAEDLGTGDLTTRLTVPEGQRARGTFYAKQSLVVAGLPVAAEVFRTLEPGCRWLGEAAEGEEVASGEGSCQG